MAEEKPPPSKESEPLLVPALARTLRFLDTAWQLFWALFAFGIGAEMCAGAFHGLANKSFLWRRRIHPLATLAEDPVVFWLTFSSLLVIGLCVTGIALVLARRALTGGRSKS